MFSEKYSFEAFIERAKALGSLDEVIRAANGACASAERASWEVRGSVAARAAGSVEYTHRLKAFLFFFREGGFPAGLDRHEIALYRKVAESLADKGQMDRNILKLLDP